MVTARRSRLITNGDTMRNSVRASALRDALTIDYYPSVTAISALVTDAAGTSYLHTEKFLGFYCDEEDCPDDAATECPLHPGDYWADTIRARYYYATRNAGLTIDALRGL